MKRKFILKSANKEVKVGDHLFHFVTVAPGVIIPKKELLTRELLTELIKEEVIKVVKIPHKSSTTKKATKTTSKEFNSRDFLGIVMHKISKKTGGNGADVCKLLSKLTLAYPSVAFQVALRQLAIDMDAKYPDHIRNSKTIFVIDSTNGNVVQINPKTITSFLGFAAFRTREEAERARMLASPLCPYINDESEK